MAELLERASHRARSARDCIGCVEQHGAGFREYDAKPAICTDQTRDKQGCSHRRRNTALEFSGYANCLAPPEYPPVAAMLFPHGGPIKSLSKSLAGPKPIAVILRVAGWVSLQAAA
jgi:hypothetical protein